MPEKWFVGHRRPHVLGATTWYGAYRSEAEARRDLPIIQEHWSKREGISGPLGYTFGGDESGRHAKPQ